MKGKGFLLIILASVLWGTSGIFVHFLSPLGFSPLQMSAMRGTVAVVCLLLYILLKDRRLFRISRRAFFFSLAAGIAMYGCGTFYYLSMQMTSVSTAVMLMYTAPVFVMAYSVLFLGEKLTRQKLVSLVCMLVGCALISGVVGGLKFHLLGIFFGLMAGVSYSIYNVLTKMEMQESVNPLSATFYCFVAMTVAALVIAPPLPILRTAAAAPSYAVFLMVGIGICTSVLPYFLYTLSLRHLPVGTAAALGILEPMAATLYSVLLLGERLSLYSVCGIVLILGAVFLLSQSKE